MEDDKNKVPELGDLVKDVYTAFKGTVIAKTAWLNGCVRVTVQPEDLDKDDKIREMQAFDIQQVEVLKKRPPVIAAHAQAPHGGPHDEPKRPRDPQR